MEDKELSFTGHLEELRKRIIISLAVFIAAIAASFPLSKHILILLKLPACGLIDKLAFFSPQEAFMSYFKIAAGSGLVISMPVFLYQLWAFISPAMGEGLRKHTARFIVFSLLAFICGAIFAYFFLLPAGLNFLLSFGKDELVPLISVGKYVSFVLAIIFAAGVVFEMPVLSFILSKTGLLNYRFLRKRFKYAILLIFILAAIITPTADVFNMTLLAVPMLFLYEISIWVSYLAGPKSGKIK